MSTRRLVSGRERPRGRGFSPEYIASEVIRIEVGRAGIQRVHILLRLQMRRGRRFTFGTSRVYAPFACAQVARDGSITKGWRP